MAARKPTKSSGKDKPKAVTKPSAAAAKKAPVAPFTPTNKPATPKKKVGQGPFAVTGKAAARLQQSDSAGYPGGPLPFVDQLGDSVITPQRLWYYKLTRFNPIKQLKPETLAHYFDLFQQGYLRYFDLLADAIEHRDPTLMTVIPKRKAAIKKLRWEVVIQQDLDDREKVEAEKHKQALYNFYNNAQGTNAVDLNVKGGMPMILDYAMNCIGHKYATFEIVWKPMEDGNITAQFNFIPLWFFENRTGKLRFLLMDYSIDGMPLKDGSFCVFVGEGLLEPCAVAYMFKHLCLRDWLMYCEKHGMPGVHGKTDSPYGSPNYNNLVNAVHSIATDFSCVTGKNDVIEKIDFSRTGESPYHPLVDYMDRTMTALWRGADLSTMSARSGGQSGGQGASLQGKEEYNIQCMDAMMINEVFNTQVDPLIIQWHFGAGVKPLACFKLVVPPNIEAATDIAILNALLDWGVEDIGVAQVMEHFGWTKMMPGDTPLMTPMEKAQMQGEMQTEQMIAQSEAMAGNEAFVSRMEKLVANARTIQRTRTRKLIEEARDYFAKQTGEALAPLRAAVEEVANAANENLLAAAKVLKDRVPTIVEAINEQPLNAKPLADAMEQAWFKGLMQPRKKA